MKTAPLPGRLVYRLTLTPGIPENRCWSVRVYDHQTRFMLQTGQPKPDDGANPAPSKPARDGSTDIYFRARGPWRQG